MSNIITAEELVNDKFRSHIDLEDVPNLMIEFAKLHVQQALISAIEVPLMDHTEESLELVNSILNCYPLENIK